MPQDDFDVWTPPKGPIVETMADISPLALAELRSHFESGDGLRMHAVNILGIKEYLERMDVETDVFSMATDGTEQSIYSYDVPAGLLQTKGALLVLIGGKYKNNTGSTQTLTIKAYYDDTVMFQHGTGALTSANQGGFTMWFVFGNVGATNSQKIAGLIFAGAALAPTVGYGGFGLNSGGPFGGTAAEDSTKKLNLNVTAQWSVADANATFSREYAHTSRIAH